MKAHSGPTKTVRGGAGGTSSATIPPPIESDITGSPGREARAAPGSGIYTPRVLLVYDALVLGFSNAYAWRCPSRLIVNLYNRNVSSCHLEVGVGTGYFLDRCRFPTPHPSLALLDVNHHSLVKAGRRLRRYAPVSYLNDVLQAPAHLGEARFDSIGLNYVLHCLPGTMGDKAEALHHLAAVLNPGGVIFGATILGRGAAHGHLARALLRLYNRMGVFDNARDGQADLEHALKAHFATVDVRVVGSVAIFIAVKIGQVDQPREGSRT